MSVKNGIVYIGNSTEGLRLVSKVLKDKKFEQPALRAWKNKMKVTVGQLQLIVLDKALRKRDSSGEHLQTAWILIDRRTLYDANDLNQIAMELTFLKPNDVFLQVMTLAGLQKLYGEI